MDSDLAGTGLGQTRCAEATVTAVPAGRREQRQGFERDLFCLPGASLPSDLGTVSVRAAPKSDFSAQPEEKKKVRRHSL